MIRPLCAILLLTACSTKIPEKSQAPSPEPTQETTKPAEETKEETTDWPAPAVSTVVPAPGQVSVATNATIVLVFSEPIAKASAASANLLVTGGSSGLVAGAVEAQGRTVTF